MSGRTGHFVTDFTVNKTGEAFLIAPGATPLSGDGSSDFSQLSKFSSTGERLWDISPAAADLEQVASDGQGSVFVLGKSGLHKFAADGASLWQRDLNFSSELYDNTELVVAGDDHVYGITGTSYLNATEGYSDGKLTVVKFNAQGELLWQTVLGPEPFLGFNAAAADASGRLYLVGTGDVLSETLPRYLIRVSPDGALDWQQQLDFGERGGLLTAPEVPLAIAVGTAPNDLAATRAYIAGLWGQPNSGSASQDAFLYRANVDDEQGEAVGVWVQY